MKPPASKPDALGLMHDRAHAEAGPARRLRIVTANAFTPDDIRVMWALIEGATTAGRGIASTREFARLAGKVGKMRGKARAGV